MNPRRVVVLVVAFLFCLGLVGLHRGARAAGVLTRFSGDTDSRLARYGRHEVRTESHEFTSNGRTIAYDVHRPIGRARGAMLLVHGMHALGHREPRLVSLADAFASAGVEVWTPRIDSLASYEISPLATHDIGLAATELARSRGVAAVPVFGISFAGGIALVTAADPQLGRSISGVVALGAHDDLARVARWFAGDEARGPNGESVAIEPHPYGAQLFLLAEPERFFGAQDAVVAEELMQLCLHDRWRDARARQGELSQRSRDVMNGAMRGELDAQTATTLRALIDDRGAALAALSPYGRVAGVHVPVLLLHGSADPIVPATEAYHLARDVPHAQVLVTDALRHAEGAEGASLGENLALVRFVDRVLDLSDAGAWY